MDLVARQHDQREGHDRKPAHLPQRAEPQVGNPLPADAPSGGCRTGGPEARGTGPPAPECAIISATTIAGTDSSTIITRFSVPSSSTVAMPTDTWNSDSRRSWPQRQPLGRRIRKGQPGRRQLP